MGVLGLATFLRKECPGVIHNIPDRLRAFSGKTVVIDGTLITQRMHFAPAPHPYRHVLGWYNLIKELKEYGVQMICVFDGQQRTKAKSRELERRKEVQRLAAIRGAMETGRLRRLRKMGDLLEQFNDLPNPEQGKVTVFLKTLIEMAEHEAVHADNVPPLSNALNPPLSLPPAPVGTQSRTLDTRFPLLEQSDLQPRAHETLPLPLTPDDTQPRALETLSSLSGPSDSRPRIFGTFSPLSESDDSQSRASDTLSPPIGLGNSQPHVLSTPNPSVAETLLRDELSIDQQSGENTPSEAPQTPPLTLWLVHNLFSVIAAVMHCSKRFAHEVHSNSRVSSADLPQTSSRNLEHELASLYMAYRMNSATSSSALIPRPSDVRELDNKDIRAPYTMSKNQHQLTQEEGKLWAELFGIPSLDADEEPSAQTSLPELEKRSSDMYQSYLRRIKSPTKEVFDDCRAILCAMGVPCLEATGGHEAEALASSLVLNGHADYVASEDTDVLVYGVPLLRNLSSRSGPLVVVSGKDVRTVLELEPAPYVDFAVLLGTDFSQRIKNVGPHRALKFIRQHGTIERVLECETRYTSCLPSEDYLEQVALARSIFHTLPPIPDVDLLRPRENDEDEVVKILRRCGLHRNAKLEWDYEVALDGNYFGDDPTSW